ncbi:unnamed protein product [Closterium sp. Yama58-4]|nr:unnamed protein product [Closterium sp. Yama58-4]
MPVPSSGSEGSAASSDWGFSGPVKGFPSAQTAPLSALDVAAPAEQSPVQGEKWEALYASVQDAVLMYNAQFVSALADGFPPAADVMTSLDETLQDLAKDVYVALDKMDEDDLTVLEQLLEEAGDEIQGVFLNCKGSLYGLGVTHARSLARFSILGKALKAAIEGATEASFTVVRDGRELSLTADSKAGTPTAAAAAAAEAAAETPKGPRLGARILLERIRDYQWLAEWLGIDPDELLIHKVLSVVPVGMLLTDLGVPRSLESSLLESQRPLLLRVVLPGFREEVKRRLVGAGLAWTEGMLIKTVVFEPKRNVAVFTTGGGSAATGGDAAGAGAGGSGTDGGAAGTAAAAAAAAGRALAKKPSHNRTKSAEDMEELSPFVSHAVQESLTAGGGLAKQIPLEDILAATDSWSPERKLGEGAYGTVFKGVVGRGGEGGDGEMWAVKRAGNVSGSHLEEFEKEVSFMSRMAHQHLVRLIGFWADCDERILIYEFMHNGTLASRIHRSMVPASPTGEAPKKAPPPPLSFDERVIIAVGAAEGLRYLHDFARPPVIHRDIKSENILLTADLQAKVADFGLLKTSDQGGPGQHVARTRLMGTPGYCDPEYSRTYIATPKSDVYSFGVVLLELVTGRRAILAEPSQKTGMNLGNVASLLQRSKRNAKASVMEPGATTTLVQWAIPLITAGKLKSVVDPALENNYPPGGMKAFANVAVMCVQKSAAQRPTMAEVATRLSAIRHKVQDLHIQGEEPKYNFHPTIGPSASAGAPVAAAATPIPRAQTAPRPKSPAPKVPQKKAGEKSGSGAGAKAKTKDAGAGEGKEAKGKKAGGKGVTRAKSAAQPYLGAKDAVEFSSQHVTSKYMAMM